jgi:hypothetical protein
MSSPIPNDKVLYNRIVARVKSRVGAWPSAYASSMVVTQYKAAGGTYSGRASPKVGLKRWHAEEWKRPDGSPCGRRTSREPSPYPYCRPTKRISPKTPKTQKELGKTKVAAATKAKARSPAKRVYVSRAKL